MGNILKKTWYEAKKLFTKTTFRNIVIVAIITTFLKVIGFYKETVIASNYGLSEFLDAFLIAILIPSFLQSVFINSFKNIFIPNYILELKQNKSIGEFQSITVLSILAITLSTIIFTYLISDYFLENFYPGHSENFYNLIKIQLYYLIPCLLLWGFSSFLNGLLEIKGKFLLSSLSGIFIPISILISVYFFNSYLGVKVLAIGTLIGSIFSFFYLIIVCHFHAGIQLKKPILNENSKLMLKQLPPKVSSGFLTGMNNFVDQYFAAQLAVGSIAAISYGIKIPSFMLGISIIAIGNVLLPYFSIKTADNVINAYKELFKILKGVFIVGLIATALVYIFSYEIIEFLFERKEFTSKNTIMVSNIQKIILVYIPFYLCGNILVKFLTSINKNKFMAWQSFFKLIANIILNIILIQKYGIYGLALSTTIVITINSIIYFTFTYKQYKIALSNEGF